MSTAPVRTMPLPVRLRQALRHPENWWQAGRYAAVGAGGYVVSVSVFALGVHLGAGYILAASIAFVCALVHNFAWNRHWTFRAGGGHAWVQWAKWVAINVGALLFSFVVLHALIAGFGVGRVAAQAVAVAAAAPPNFICHKLWTFRL